MDTLTKAVQGDNQAFTCLYEEFRQEIFSFLLGRIRNRENALDLTADIFIAAYSGIQSFEGSCSFRTWLYAIARHKLNDYYARRGQQQARFVEAAEDFEGIENPENDIHNLESELDLTTILQKLTPAEQEILLLHNINGMKFSECAEVLQISEGSARVYHQRALIKARKIAQSGKVKLQVINA